MNLLAFDTSTEVLSIGVAAGAQLLLHSGAGGAQASFGLIAGAQSLLAQAGLAMPALDANMCFMLGSQAGMPAAEGQHPEPPVDRPQPLIPEDTERIVERQVDVKLPTEFGTFDLSPDVLTAIAATHDNGSGVDSVTELQALVSQVLASNTQRITDALARIATYAGDANTAAGTTAPTLSDYQVAGITGVSSANLAALNSALATTAVIDTATDTAPEIQTLVDAYNRILAEANGPAVDATPGVNPSATDYTAIGATTAAALSTSGLALLNDVVGSLSTRQVDTVAKIEALANISAALMSTAAGGSPSPALSLADFSALGITGVTAYNLNAVVAAIAASNDSGTDINSLSALQTLVNNAAAQAVLDALATVQAYAGSNSTAAGSTPPVLNDYLLLGITGVDVSNIAAIQSALATLAVDASDLGSAADVQTLVNAYNRILAEANGTAADATPGASPSAADYSAIGATTAAALPASGLALLGDVIGNLPAASVSTVAQIEALASTAGALQSLAALSAAPTPLPAITLTELAALGLTGLNADNLPVFLNQVALAANNGSGTDSLAELQALVTLAQQDYAQILLAQQRQQAAVQLIQAYAGDANTPAGTTAPLLSDFTTAGVTQVNASNLASVHSALASVAITGADVGMHVHQPRQQRAALAVEPQDARLAQRLLQLLQHMGRRRQVRIAHAHVDDVGPGVPRGRLGPIDLLEHIRRQTADTIKLFHGSGLREPVKTGDNDR